MSLLQASLTQRAYDLLLGNEFSKRCDDSARQSRSPPQYHFIMTESPTTQSSHCKAAKSAP